jgi:hypothetical protein
MHGSDTSTFAYGMWTVVAFDVLLFVFFAISFVRPKGGVEWRTMGILIYRRAIYGDVRTAADDLFS